MIHDLIYYTAVSIKQSVIVWIVIEGFFYIFQKKFRIKKCLFDFIFIMWFFTMLHIVGMYDLHLDFGNNSTRMLPKVIPFVGTSGGMDIANVLLFLPGGVLIPFVLDKIKWNYKRILMVIVPLVSCVEILQYFGCRLFDIDDVIANSLGAVLGYWLYQIYILKSIQTNGDQYNEDEFNMKNNIL